MFVVCISLASVIVERIVVVYTNQVKNVHLSKSTSTKITTETKNYKFISAKIFKMILNCLAFYYIYGQSFVSALIVF